MLDILTSKIEGYKEMLTLGELKASAKNLKKTGLDVTGDISKQNIPKTAPPAPKINVSSKVAETNAVKTSKKLEEEATVAQKAEAKKLEKSEDIVDYCSNNKKKCIAAGGAGTLALYMVVKGETNPAKAAGEMVGDVGKGAAGGLLDGLGLGFLTGYLPYMSLCCSGFMFMFMFLYMFKTFLH